VNVHFSVLGPVRGWRGPAELGLGPNQQRAILGLLLVKANQLVTIDDLMELLWGEDPPGSAVNVIHKYIGVIRRLLEPDLVARSNGRWLARQGGAYRLAADEPMSDLISFRRMVADAGSAHAGGRPAAALDLLLEALALGRGACGEGLDLHGRNRDYFAAVDQEFVAAVARAADAALACAQPSRVLPLLRRAALGEPLNESLQARLILTLAATGQQAPALSHYRRVRAQLSDELGVDPGTELRAAQVKVLRQEFPAVPAGPPPDPPPDPPPVPPGAPARAPFPLVPPAQLPADLPTFSGRGPELSQASKMLSPDGEFPMVAICAIDGMAGIGKTTFAIHWAHHVAKHFEDGQLYLNLRGFDSSAAAMAPAEALRTLLYSLGIPAGHIPSDLDARAGLYRSVLARKRVLIVLDNARDVEQIRPLLPAGPGCLVIATSRNPLAGLAMAEGARLLTLNLPSALTAIETLERRLGADRVAAEPEAVQEIIELCGRLPLALAIVAARAAVHPGFTLASIAADLRRTQGRLDAFGTVGVAADARTVFSWSYHHLSPQACRLFRLLSLQPATDITAAAAASLLGVPPEEVSGLAAELTSTALITEHQPGRYCFHDLIRAYATELSERIDTETDRHRALARLLHHYLYSSYAAQVKLKPYREPITPGPLPPGATPEQFSDHESAMSWFTAERQVLNASVALAARSDFGFPAWQLALTMQQLYQWRGFFHDWKHSMETALHAAERDGDLPGQGHVLTSLAEANFHLGRPAETVRCLERAQAIYTDLGYTTEHAYLHTSFGEIFAHQGEPQRALEQHEKALELYREAGHRRGEARAIADIGAAQSGLGDYEEAVPRLEWGIALAQQISTRHQEGKVRTDLGIVRSKLGQQDEAVEQFKQALILIRGVGDRPMEAETLLALGDALAAQGRHDAACDAWHRAALIFSAFLLPHNDKVQSRLARSANETARL
jgi:DNA-binding SARP family transcriptional activator/tetratricopeptide (TPR) repeat protein